VLTGRYPGAPAPRRATLWLSSGQCFGAYRRRGGQRSSPLPDFYIGAHAAAEGLTLVTRDPVRFETYFPGLDLIAPGRR